MSDANILVLSGGGKRGISTLGALHYLLQEGYLNNIQTYIGTSVGSIIGLFMSIGMKPIEMFTKLFNINIFTQKDDVNIFNMLSIITKFGLYDPSHLVSLVESTLIELTGQNLTMEEHFNLTSTRLIINTTNITTMKAVYIDHISHPDLRCSHAVKMSVAIPLIFTPVQYDGCHYVDGGFLNNFPLDYLDFPPNKIIGVCCCQKIGVPPTDVFFIQFLMNIIDLPLTELTRLRIDSCSDRCKIVNIKADKCNLFNPSMDVPFMNALFSMGYTTAANTVKKWRGGDEEDKGTPLVFITPVSSDNESDERDENDDERDDERGDERGDENDESDDKRETKKTRKNIETK
jgi:predicted acylesterase/phospholipase RssA